MSPSLVLNLVSVVKRPLVQRLVMIYHVVSYNIFPVFLCNLFAGHHGPIQSSFLHVKDSKISTRVS